MNTPKTAEQMNAPKVGSGWVSTTRLTREESERLINLPIEIAALKARVEEAWKQGMTDAAKIAGQTICNSYPDCGSVACDAQHAVQQNIIRARDKKGTHER